jgi:uncharacterized protein YjbI with pentapeptide repeats
MPVSIDWLDHTRSVIYCAYTGAQEWSELYQAASIVATMMQGARHTVHILIDAQHSAGLPRSSPFPHLKRAVSSLPENTGVVIIISQKLFIKMTLALVTKFYDTGDRLFLVGTAEEAEAILNERRSKQVLKDELMHAMSSNNPAVSLRAVEELRNREWLYDGSLVGGNFAAANLSEADLFMANLSDTKLQMAVLEGANLFMANLESCNLRRANLHGASLVQTNLQKAMMQEDDLSGADLSMCNLGRANLRLANLCGANLYAANLWGVNLHGAVLDNTTVLPNGEAYTCDDDLMPFIDPNYAPVHVESSGQDEDATLAAQPEFFPLEDDISYPNVSNPSP